MTTNYRGIDYSGIGATCNRDSATGIRYGILSANCEHLTDWFWESTEPEYGEPACPKCGNEPLNSDHCDCPDFDDHDDIEVSGCGEYFCESCRYAFDGDEAYGDECIGNTLVDDKITGFVDSGNDIWVTDSPYFTYAQYCSPCAPGACHLENPLDQSGDWGLLGFAKQNAGNRAFCLGHDWFKDNAAPYPVYDVKTGQIVPPPAK